VTGAFGADQAVQLLVDTLITSLKVSAPLLAVILVVGLVVSVIQVVTQIQEMTLTFIPKIVCVAAVLVFTGGWMLATVVEFTRRVFNSIAGM
jgi:flagellar biosynthetic protein FliQ